ncbi:MAG: type II toxin-antitoxin system CcdA family antitoxin [Rhodospirillaceae bacterium]|nr:type II toxin-antitoxin system CcdA family antitoxin [Rhodospirillales bacterium]
MKPIFDPKAPKTVRTLSINEDLLRQTRKLGIDLSQTLETSLTDKVREAKAKA